MRIIHYTISFLLIIQIINCANQGAGGTGNTSGGNGKNAGDTTSHTMDGVTFKMIYVPGKTTFVGTTITAI